MNKEIEVKYEIKNKNEIAKKLKDLGFKKIDRIFSKTYGFFTPDGKSIKNGIFPRIRIDNGKASITVKVRKGKKVKYFQRDEYNFCIENYSEMVDILKALGYSDVRIFEKIRDMWIYKNIEVCIDKLPFGDFIEIEATPKQIEEMIKKLELKGKRITKAYLAVYEDWCRSNRKKISKDICFHK